MREIDITRYFPDILLDAKEIKEYIKGVNPELRLLFDYIRVRFLDRWVHDADIYGVERYEKLLSIVPISGETLDDRKFRILLQLNNAIPYTFKALEQKIEGICGKGKCKLNMDYDAFTIDIYIDIKSNSQFEEVGIAVERMCPANLIVNIKPLYNSYAILSTKTHKELSNFTHKELRMESFR